MSGQEEPLTGGNTSESVVRVGDTVRKPWGPNTGRVVEYMAALSDRGIDIPQPLGRDERGRAMFDLLYRSHRSGREPWASMFVDGHGNHWRATCDYLVTHQGDWRGALT